MKYTLEIHRQLSPREQPYVQTFLYETELMGATVATALSALNERSPLCDTEGKPCDKIVWECSCLQQKCGACAMLINGKPQLACRANLAAQKGTVIRLEPLRKFPLVADLMVDRDSMFDSLRELQLWAEGNASAREKNNSLLYEASRCLQCGCCLEVCPNFEVGGSFFGAAAMVPASRLLEELDPTQGKQLRKQYGKRFFNGCGKSNACREICPAGIDTERLMVNSNAVFLWKHLFRKQR